MKIWKIDLACQEGIIEINDMKSSAKYLYVRFSSGSFDFLVLIWIFLGMLGNVKLCWEMLNSVGKC